VDYCQHPASHCLHDHHPPPTHFLRAHAYSNEDNDDDNCGQSSCPSSTLPPKKVRRRMLELEEGADCCHQDDAPPRMMAMDDAMDNAKTYDHCGGEDGDGTKTMMLRDHHCWRLVACARSAGRRVQIVVVRMMPPHGRWAMDNATDDAKTYSHCGGEDGDGTKMMMLHDHRCWRSAACMRSAGRRVQIVVVRMPPHGRWAMDDAMAIARWRQILRQRWW
jgi:hypothetical protein